MPNYTLINAIGSTVISGATLTVAGYLLYSLIRQGKGKLRVRLLVGMVISDICLGVVILPAEIAYLKNGGAAAGSAGCTAQGFILVVILFTQHLWTLVIALATFLLLRYPLSPITSLMERHSWALAPLIWGVSILHAGIWQGTVGFTNTGTLCYYASKDSSDGLDRDLMQFIPRALVFVVIILLYSRLFTFLRRPDTIHLSNHFVSGSSDPEQQNHSGTPKTLLRPIARLGRMGSHSNAPNPEAPWEALEFIHVGGINHLAPDSEQATHTGRPSLVGSLSNGAGFIPSVPTGIILPAQESPELSTSSYESKDPSGGYVLHGVRTSSASSRASGSVSWPTPTSQRPSAVDTLVAHDPANPYTGSSHSLSKLAMADNSPPPPMFHALSPVMSQGSKLEMDIGVDPLDQMPVVSSRRGEDGPRESEEAITLDLEDGEDGEDGDREGQTMKEFFQEFQVPAGADDSRHCTGSGGHQQKPQRSAASYFNRQASLLMLYFPLAYMFVFSISLVRLVYDMVHEQASPVLSIMSSWMVISVGLIDGLVYGIAELMVRRKVRRKMPEHMGH
ncbi:hypothetical protein IAT38_001127 [Cryptococcus sp. DSM 104549]